MRAWGRADPRMLNRYHLLGEHRELHVLGKRSNGPGPEYERFWSHIDSLSALILRHELVRAEMNQRWPGIHTRSTHPTPMRWKMMRPAHKQVYATYAERIHKWHRSRTRNYKLLVVEQKWFERRMHDIKFPPCALEGGADTPWDRDGISLTEYLKIGDNWRRDIHHYQRRKEWKSGRRT